MPNQYSEPLLVQSYVETNFDEFNSKIHQNFKLEYYKIRIENLISEEKSQILQLIAEFSDKQ